MLRPYKQIVSDKLMFAKYWIHLAELTLAILLAIAVYFSWRAERRDRDALQAELAATKQLLSAADSRQHDRDSQLVQTLASLAAEKRTVTTPAQIIRELPQAIPLPVPLTLQPDAAASSLNTTASASPTDAKSGGNSPGNPAARALQAAHAHPGGGQVSNTESPRPKVVIPTEDLKPLYDFALNCKACQAKLAASQADLTDEKTKTDALTKERDDAVRAARGGSVLRRIARAAKWFAIGAAAGAIAAKTAH
jgi:type II secretory pathway pseudopilin PulG